MDLVNGYMQNKLHQIAEQCGAYCPNWVDKDILAALPDGLQQDYLRQCHELDVRISCKGEVYLGCRCASISAGPMFKAKCKFWLPAFLILIKEELPFLEGFELTWHEDMSSETLA